MNTRVIGRWILIADLAWCLIAFIAADALRYEHILDPSSRIVTESLLPFLVLTAVSWVLLSSWMKLDCFRGGWRFPAVVAELLLSIVCLMSMVLSAGYLWRQYVSRLALVYFGLLLFIGFLGIRFIARLLLLARYRSGDVHRMVIVGTDRTARELALKIKRHPEMICEVVGFLCPDESGGLIARGLEETVTVPAFGVTQLLLARQVTDIIVALPRPSLPEILNLVGQCRERGINVSFVPQPYELYLSKPSLIDLDGIPILELRKISPPDFYLASKRVVDLVLGIFFAMIALPIVLPVALRLRTTKSRAFRIEKRCGLGGAVFSMLRLNVDREPTDASQFERLLVALSITELPQLWNVLQGTMSLVGPRPEPLEKVKGYSDWEQQRLSVKPGMTGLAQIHGLRDHHSSEQKTRFDLQYILNPSAMADASILIQTFWTLTTRLLGYPELVRSAYSEPRSLTQVETRFREETLQSAHSSQSSAD